MSQGNALFANAVFHQLQKKFGYYGKHSTIKLPFIHKFEKQESKNRSQSQEKPCVIKLFERTTQIKQTFRKIRPALLALYEIFPDQENVAQLETDLLQLKESKFYFVKYKHFGESFKQFLEDQVHPLDEKSVFNYCLLVAKGLAQLQYVGINHRDVKVSNVIMVDKKTLKVIDFDISKTQRSTKTIKKMTINKMTLCYSSPWKLLSIIGDSVEKDNMGFRDDAYSLGLLILEVIFNKTSLQKPLQKFIDSDIETKINKKSYLKIMRNLMKQFANAKDKFSQNIKRLLDSVLVYSALIKVIELIFQAFINSSGQYQLMKTGEILQIRLMNKKFQKQIKEIILNNTKMYIPQAQKFQNNISNRHLKFVVNKIGLCYNRRRRYKNHKNLNENQSQVRKIISIKCTFIEEL